MPLKKLFQRHAKRQRRIPGKPFANAKRYSRSPGAKDSAGTLSTFCIECFQER